MTEYKKYIFKVRRQKDKMIPDDLFSTEPELLEFIDRYIERHPDGFIYQDRNVGIYDEYFYIAVSEKDHDLSDILNN